MHGQNTVTTKRKESGWKKLVHVIWGWKEKNKVIIIKSTDLFFQSIQRVSHLGNHR